MTALPRRATVTKTLADLIEDLLPQTQCTKCGYAACRPYAEALASGEADINQCPPGGMEGVRRSVLIGHADPGTHLPFATKILHRVATNPDIERPLIIGRPLVLNPEFLAIPDQPIVCIQIHQVGERVPTRHGDERTQDLEVDVVLPRQLDQQVERVDATTGRRRRLRP